MKTTTLVKLLIVLCLFLGLWYLQNWKQKSQSDLLSGWGELTTEEVQADNVNKITITKGTETMELTKPEAEWLVDGTAADITKVNQLLEILRSPQVEIISQNQERYATFGITDDQAHQLRFWQGDSEKIVILVSTENQTIIRKKDHQNVYRLTTPLNLITNINAWIAAPTPTPTPEQTLDESEISEPQL
jgi:hypothetical protein